MQVLFLTFCIRKEAAEKGISSCLLPLAFCDYLKSLETQRSEQVMWLLLQLRFWQEAFHSTGFSYAACASGVPDKNRQTLLSALCKEQLRKAKQSSKVVSQERPRVAGGGGSAE